MTQKIEPSMFYQNQSGELINVAEICPATRALGPGLRSVLWVQGCPFNCAGCIAKEWTALKVNKLLTVDQVVDQLLSDSRVAGITVSGGEPMLQARALSQVIRFARERRKLNIICFTGYQLEHLRQRPPNQWVSSFLETVDVLIDGQYVRELNDNTGLRGSSNQRIHFLTQELFGIDFEKQIRTNEIQILDGQALLIGIPPKEILMAFDAALASLNEVPARLVENERS